MSEAERYVMRAEQLEQIAAESFVPDHRRQLLEVAQEWRRMAEQLARIERIEVRSFGAAHAAD